MDDDTTGSFLKTSRHVSVWIEAAPEAVYEFGRSQLLVRVPGDASRRFPAVVRAADALLETVSAPSSPKSS